MSLMMEINIILTESEKTKPGRKRKTKVICDAMGAPLVVDTFSHKSDRLYLRGGQMSVFSPDVVQEADHTSPALSTKNIRCTLSLTVGNKGGLVTTVHTVRSWVVVPVKFSWLRVPSA